MYINIDEVLRIKGRLDSIKNELENDLMGVNSELREITEILQSKVLINSNRLIYENVINLIKTLNTNIEGLITFIGDQMQDYQVSNEKAKKQLETLVHMLENAFDKDGNVLTSYKQAYSKAVLGDAGDQNAYVKGEGDQAFLEGKLGGSEACRYTLEKSYFYFKEKGLTDEQIAGILGNMAQESGFNVDITNMEGSSAKGLFQWMPERHPDDWSLETQLDHAWAELNGEWNDGKGIYHLQNSTSVNDATYQFAQWFEGYGFEGENLAGRQRFARDCYWYIKNM